jgi:hypothetical protein
MKRKLQALAVLLVFGAAKLPVESWLSRQLLDARLLNPPVDFGLRENLGQMGFAATLGGLRSLIASITYLQAYHEWENVNWGKVDQLFQITIRLQPRFANYWDEAAWHMASNAASSYYTDQTLDPKLRQELAVKHVVRGIEIINEGLRVLPNESKLWVRLAEIHERLRVPGFRDPVRAGDAYPARATPISKLSKPASSHFIGGWRVISMRRRTIPHFGARHTTCFRLPTSKSSVRPVSSPH